MKARILNVAFESGDSHIGCSIDGGSVVTRSKMSSIAEILSRKMGGNTQVDISFQPEFDFYCGPVGMMRFMPLTMEQQIEFWKEFRPSIPGCLPEKFYPRATTRVLEPVED